MQSEPGKTLLRWAYAAVAWLVVSFVWHVQMGVMYEATMGPDDGTPLWLFLSYDALIVLMSVVGVVCVLATVKPWGRRAPHWLVRAPLWIGCAVLTMRGVPGLVENVTTATGLTPHGLLGMEKEAVDTGSWDFWKTMVINAYFFLGAVLLVPATVLSRRSRRTAKATRTTSAGGTAHPNRFRQPPYPTAAPPPTLPGTAASPVIDAHPATARRARSSRPLPGRGWRAGSAGPRADG
ncbi:hypothetical protein [Streptomyces lydicus]|uniref:hypothetical protein n=1 Tax=Streptomyces lydicus TaxID=47763 RepID=UPI0036EE96E1